MVTAIAFSPDGKSLVSGGPDQVRLWEVATGEQRRLLGAQQPEGHQSDPFRVAFAPDGRTLATSSGDNKIRIWDPAGWLSNEGSQTRKPSVQEREALGADLASQDAAKGYLAICTLVQWPEDAVAFLKERWQTVARADPQRIPQLLADLDSSRFEVRQKAIEGLEQLGDLAEPALQKVVGGKPSLEVRRQAELLLKKLEGPVTSPERLRALRGVEVLEQIGTPQARQVLETLTQGTPGAELTEEAKTALARLAKRPLPSPEPAK